MRVRINPAETDHFNVNEIGPNLYRVCCTKKDSFFRTCYIYCLGHQPGANP